MSQISHFLKASFLFCFLNSSLLASEAEKETQTIVFVAEIFLHLTEGRQNRDTFEICPSYKEMSNDHLFSYKVSLEVKNLDSEQGQDPDKIEILSYEISPKIISPVGEVRQSYYLQRMLKKRIKSCSSVMQDPSGMDQGAARLCFSRIETYMSPLSSRSLELENFPNRIWRAVDQVPVFTNHSFYSLCKDEESPLKKLEEESREFLEEYLEGQSHDGFTDLLTPEWRDLQKL